MLVISETGCEPLLVNQQLSAPLTRGDRGVGRRVSPSPVLDVVLILHPLWLFYLWCFPAGAIGIFAGGHTAMNSCAGACLALVLPLPFHLLIA